MFAKFLQHFKEEMDAIGDNMLAKEIGEIFFFAPFFVSSQYIYLSFSIFCFMQRL